LEIIKFLTNELRSQRDSRDKSITTGFRNRAAQSEITKPINNSFDRALLAVFIGIIKNLDASSTFVDLGCGDGMYLRTIFASSYSSTVIGVDVDIGSLRTAIRLDRSIGKRDINYINCDVNNLPFRRNSISAALMTNIIHHMNSTKMLATLKYLLRKDAPFVMVEKVSNNPLNKLSIAVWPIIRHLFTYESLKTEHLDKDLSTPFIRYRSINTITEYLHNCDYHVRSILYNKCTVLLLMLYLFRPTPFFNTRFFNLFEKSVRLIDNKIANFFGWKCFTVAAGWICFS